MYDCQVRARCAEDAERGQSGILKAAIGGSYKAAGRRGLPIYDLRFTICDLRFAICDLRFAICDLRFARVARGEPSK